MKIQKNKSLQEENIKQHQVAIYYTYSVGPYLHRMTMYKRNIL